MELVGGVLASMGLERVSRAARRAILAAAIVWASIAAWWFYEAIRESDAQGPLVLLWAGLGLTIAATVVIDLLVHALRRAASGRA